jgi:hypothetical protein
MGVAWAWAFAACSGAEPNQQHAGASGSSSHAGSASGAGGSTSGAAGNGTAGMPAGGSGGSSSSSGAGGGDDGNASSSKVEACLAYVKAYCAFFARCQGTAESAVCYDRSASDCPDLLFSEGSSRTPSGVAECAGALASWSCERYAKGELPSCITPGTKAVGDQCAFPSQCASLSCATTGGCGTCNPVPQPGGPCDEATSRVCPAGQRCMGTTCVDGYPLTSEVAPGGTCDDQHQCNSQGYCLEGKCQARVALGGSCVSSNVCAVGSYCDINAGKCAGPPPPGQPCATDQAVKPCDAKGVCENGTCVALPGAGQACYEPSGGACAPGFWCRVDMPVGSLTRVCEAVSSSYTNCQNQYQCGDGYACELGKCLQRSTYRGTCDAAHVCPGLSTCMNGSCAPIESQGLFAMRCPG